MSCFRIFCYTLSSPTGLPFEDQVQILWINQSGHDLVHVISSRSFFAFSNPTVNFISPQNASRIGTTEIKINGKNMDVGRNLRILIVGIDCVVLYKYNFNSSQ